ncbi:glycosyltransferase [Ichthyobacterium seriolicida]|uniref:Glycosyl transferase, group 1 n=1 Tax=Ichthyobacterium seriolicida TaxID=242600 RepID=A0A1J1DYC5_9FLAO|nr:glycosyltransferase [Ichthyobacterium seriolicida]BAV94898.1 glycosyl transferase, group 1 [Ichthyobacterium seriolicida]
MSSSSKVIVCFGAGPIFKGGMSNYNTSLAKSLSKFEHTKVHIVSWTHQYPSIIPRNFKDKVSSINFLEGTDIDCKYITNYNNPFSWNETVKYILSLNADKVIIQWSIAIQGLPISFIIKSIKNNSNCEVIVDLHFLIQKERSTLDKKLTRIGIENADSYIVHDFKTYMELVDLFPDITFELSNSGQRNIKSDSSKKTVIKLFHPIYDLYKSDPIFDAAAFKKKYGLRDNVFLFFGFIRKYKGLHNAIKAFDIVAKKRDDVSFLICGEMFWNTLKYNSLRTKIKKTIFSIAKRVFLNSKDEDQDYNPLKLIDELNLRDRIVVVDKFIPNEDVNKYFAVSNAVVLFYSRATPSGIESLSYNFNLPILTTRTGHFPETVKDGQNGYMVEENTVESMAQTMFRFLDNPIPMENIKSFKENLSWEVYSKAIIKSFKENLSWEVYSKAILKS